MGVKIGCPCLKLSKKLSSRAGKHSGSMAPVLMEAWEPRNCKDEDFHPERTKDNVYLVGPKNAFEIMKQIDAEAEAYSLERKAKGGKKLQDTAATGFAIILKPPAEYINSLSTPDREKFLWDMFESFQEVAKKHMAPDAVKGAVIHRDEAGEHIHICGVCKTPDGRINAHDVISTALFRDLNRRLPEEMNKKQDTHGKNWDIETCAQWYDPEHAKTLTEEQKAEYIAEVKKKKPKTSGLDSKSFKKMKDALKEIQAENEALKRQLREAQERPRVAEPQRPPERPQKPQEAQEGPRVEVPKGETRKPQERPQEAPGSRGREKQMADEARARIAALLQQTDKPGKADTLHRVNSSIAEMARRMAREQEPTRKPPEQPQKPQEAQERPRVEVPRGETKKPQEATQAPRPLPSNAPTLRPSLSRVHDTGREI